MRWLRDWLIYLLVRFFVCLVQAVRPETCNVFARWLAVLACDVIGIRRRTVDENIHLVFPDLTPPQRRLLARRMWEHLLLMVCEIAQAPRKIHETNWRHYIDLHRHRDAVRYLLDQRPIVLVSGHYGNFELTSYVIGLLGFPSFSIARRLDNPFLERYVHRFRSANGQFILPTDGSSGQVDEVLRSGGTIALLGDQRAGPRGCWVDFLGRPASCHKAVALFTLISGAPLLVCYGRRVGGPLQVKIGVEAIADPHQAGDHLSGVKELTRWYNAALERIILADPCQYWWLHRRWKGDPNERRRRPQSDRQAKPNGWKRQAA